MTLLFNVPVIEQRLKAEVSATIRALRSELRSTAPIRSGRFRQGWHYRLTVGNTDHMSGVIFNSVPYAPIIEGGVEKGADHPWGKKEGLSKGLVYSKGKIWSKNAPGGTIDPLIIDRKSWGLNFARRIADAVVGGMK